MLKHLSIFVLCFVCAMLAAAKSCNSDSSSASSKDVNITKEELLHCSTDADCIAMNADCCGCNQGGKQKPVSAKAAKELQFILKARCKKTVCPMMISDDPSCFKTPKCSDEQCQLE